jgi:hypothetical protein
MAVNNNSTGWAKGQSRLAGQLDVRPDTDAEDHGVRLQALAVVQFNVFHPPVALDRFGPAGRQHPDPPLGDFLFSPDAQLLVKHGKETVRQHLHDGNILVIQLPAFVCHLQADEATTNDNHILGPEQNLQDVRQIIHVLLNGKDVSQVHAGYGWHQGHRPRGQNELLVTDRFASLGGDGPGLFVDAGDPVDDEIDVILG